MSSSAPSSPSAVATDRLRRIADALEAGDIATWSMDLPSQRVWGDAALKRFFAVDDDDTVGGPLAHYLAAVHPDDLPSVETAITEALASRDTFLAEYRVRATDGERWVVARGRVERHADGSAKRMRGVILDIGARKAAEEAHRASEERYRGLFNATDEGFCIMEMVFDAHDVCVDYVFLETNTAFEEQTGLRGALGKRARELVPNLEPVWFEAYGAVAKTGERKRFQSGSLEMGRFFDVTAFRIGGDGSRRVALLFKDITQATRHDQALRELAEQRERLLESERAAREEAERASRLKDEFLATLSHELRTPLNAILGWASVLRRTEEHAPDTLRGLEIIERNAKAQAQIVADLLDMSAIISGKVRLAMERIDVRTVTVNAFDSMLPTAQNKGVSFVLETLPDDPVPITGDAARLQQVLWNLLSNAVKFTPRGGEVRLTLRTSHDDVAIAVHDTGIGIDPTFVASMFGRFRQGDASITRRHGGLGLGLSIAQQLVELHGGSLAVQSDGPGAGATLTINLPTTLAGRRDPSDAPHARGAEDDRHDGDLASLAGLRVLVVDDEPDARELVQRLLEDRGALVGLASDAAAAFALVASERFDALVSDIGLPGEDGYSLVRRIRALPVDRGGSLPAVAVTAYARSDDKARALEAGFQRHVVKPLAVAELVRAIAEVARAGG